MQFVHLCRRWAPSLLPTMSPRPRMPPGVYDRRLNAPSNGRQARRSGLLSCHPIVIVIWLLPGGVS